MIHIAYMCGDLEAESSMGGCLTFAGGGGIVRYPQYTAVLQHSGMGRDCLYRPVEQIAGYSV